MPLQEIGYPATLGSYFGMLYPATCLVYIGMLVHSCSKLRMWGSSQGSCQALCRLQKNVLMHLAAYASMTCFDTAEHWVTYEDLVIMLYHTLRIARMVCYLVPTPPPPSSRSASMVCFLVSPQPPMKILISFHPRRFTIATHPEVQRAIKAELASVGLLHQGQPNCVTPRQLTFEDLGHLTYLNCVIDETMRLYPVSATGSVR